MSQTDKNNVSIVDKQDWHKPRNWGKSGVRNSICSLKIRFI